MKTCTKCLVTQELSAFYKLASSKDGRRSRCKKCTSDSEKEDLIKNKERLARLPEEWTDEKTKNCSKCLKNKKLKEFHKHGRSKDGHRPQCKKCVAIYKNEVIIKNKKRLASLPKNWALGKSKICSKCKVDKQLIEYSRDTQNKDGHSTLCKKCKKAYTFENKEVIDAYTKKYKELNKKTISSYMKKWRKNNSEYIKINNESYRKDNPEYFITYRHTNKEAILTSAKNYREDNKASRNAQASKRRADLLKATPSWADLESIKEFYIKRDKLIQETGEIYHVDHIVPLIGKRVCGFHCENNLQILKASENLSKGNKFLYESNKGEMK